jgi:adenine-specific DNA-methyltransferase
MSPLRRNDRSEYVIDHVVPDLVRRLIRSSDSQTLDQDRMYRAVVGMIVDAMISGIRGSRREQGSSCTQDDRDDLWGRFGEALGAVRTKDVGEIYEHLRGFRLDLSHGDRPQLVPSIRAKRNQGLFYTPGHVVHYIVSETLNELETSNPADLLHIRIVDPAAGTGLFLAEALEQLTRRILQADRDTLASHLSLPAQPLDSSTSSYGPQRIGRAVDIENAVRIHVTEHCLYGVDLDPIAVKIAKELLVERTMRDVSGRREIRSNIQMGNSLIGQDTQPLPALTVPEADKRHLEAYRGGSDQRDTSDQCLLRELRMFHWPLQYPEVFDRSQPGFHAVIGNPPYEIVSVKESGIRDRKHEQAYFRKMYATCSGKINTYRLMLERGLKLLRPGGVLGYIVPATLLSDSTATRLREEILDQSKILRTIVIPEKARVFDGVTQALLILVTRKGEPTRRLTPALWDGSGAIAGGVGVEVSTRLIKKTNMRIPLFRTATERALLETLAAYPPLSGGKTLPPIAEVHQGEINLTTHREYITSDPTRYPLLRGEHIYPFTVRHPSPRHGRLDWILDGFPAHHEAGPVRRHGSTRIQKKHTRIRGNPWKRDRIAVGRVVNMATGKRLKAAYVPAGRFLGDMTNSITHARVSGNYLLGLLNSSVLNWRIKLTSTNNYLSAAEIKALPIPRLEPTHVSSSEFQSIIRYLEPLVPGMAAPLVECSAILNSSMKVPLPSGPCGTTARLIDWTVERIHDLDPSQSDYRELLRLWCNLLDCLVLKLFSVESYVSVFSE